MTMTVRAPSGGGSIAKLPIAPCETGNPEGPAPNERVQLLFSVLPSTINGWVEDDRGQTRGWIRPSNSNPGDRGLRFRPRCNRDYYLVLRTDDEPVSDGNLFIDQLLGAELSFISKSEYGAGIEPIYADLLAHYASLGRKAYAMPVGASDEVGLWGYIAATEELKTDFAHHGIAPRHIVCATGSGGTQGGLTLGAVLHGLDSQVWGVNVCDDADYFRRKIVADIHAWQQRYGGAVGSGDVSIATIDGYVGPGYGRADAEVFQLISELARSEGLLLDPIYTGKAFLGMVAEIRLGQRFGDAEDIVFIHTGGFFACYAQKQHFSH